MIQSPNLSPVAPSLRDRFWFFWFLVPLYPFAFRQTLRTEVVKDQVWTFEQVQGIFYVVVPLRMTVVRLARGGLLVYAPVAPTAECIRLLRELEAEQGAVKYIILPTSSGLEHKVFVGPFARYCPQAQVYVAPSQWSFPVKLPLSWLGFPRDRTQVLPDRSSEAPFAQDFDYAILPPIKLGIGIFEEVAFYHRRSQTLLVTDSILSIPEDPPAILQQDPYCLLFHARDSAQEPLVDNPAHRRKGWQRICLFALYFSPSSLNTISWPEAFRNAKTACDRTRKAYFGLYPFLWQDDWQKTFKMLRGNGQLRVAPILQTLILNRAPQSVLGWVDRICQWNFQRVIPGHFDAPLSSDNRSLRQAFAFLEPLSDLNPKDRAAPPSTLPPEDLQVLHAIDRILVKFRISPPAP